jgi:sec-independent protein translocase protein TatA
MGEYPQQLMYITWGPGQLLLVGLIILVLFGSGKISTFMGDFAKGIKAFKKGLAEDETATTAQTPTPVQPAKPIEHDPLRAADAKPATVGETKV